MGLLFHLYPIEASSQPGGILAGHQGRDGYAINLDIGDGLPADAGELECRGLEVATLGAKDTAREFLYGLQSRVIGCIVFSDHTQSRG